MEMGAGGATGGTNLGDGLTGKDVGADFEVWFSDKVAVADGEVAVLQLYEVAGACVVADSEYFAREHGIDWGAGLGREVETGMMFVATFAEWISTFSEFR